MLVRQASVRLYQIQASIRVLTVFLDAWILHYRILFAQLTKVLDDIVRTSGTQCTPFVTKMAIIQWNLEVI